MPDPLPPPLPRAVQASLSHVRATCEDRGMVEVLVMLTTKPMQLAQYFCTGLQDDPETWR